MLGGPLFCLPHRVGTLAASPQIRPLQHFCAWHLAQLGEEAETYLRKASEVGELRDKGERRT